MQIVPVTKTTVAARDEMFTTDEQQALLGFLAGYSGLTREAYQLDLRQYVQWCAERHVALFCARRADIESFGRDLESRGRARATIGRRLCTVACFHRYAEQEGLIRVSPAVHVRRPRSTTNRTRRAWTGMRSALCWSSRACAVRATTRSSACWP